MSGQSETRFYRKSLSELDNCLCLLEDAHARDEEIVSAELSSQVRPFVPAIVPRMQITEALDLVFEAQAACLRGAARPDLCPGPAPAVGEPEASWYEADSALEPLDPVGARALTEKIKATGNAVSLLLLEAHERKVAMTLGYRTWESYVRSEFGLSRTRSYELLDHARLIRSIERTTGLSSIVDIHPYAARQMRPYMARFIAELKDRVRERSADELPAIIGAALREYRSAGDPAGARPRRRETDDELDHPPSNTIRMALPEAGPAAGGDARAVWPALRYMASMPPPSAVLQQLVACGLDLPTIQRASEWLADLAAELRARDPDRRPAVMTG